MSKGITQMTVTNKTRKRGILDKKFHSTANRKSRRRHRRADQEAGRPEPRHPRRADTPLHCQSVFIKNLAIKFHWFSVISKKRNLEHQSG